MTGQADDGRVRVRAAQLATFLDHWMLEQDQHVASRGGGIATGFADMAALPSRAGGQLAAELGGRLLVRYLREHEIAEAQQGTPRPVWATPTPYGPADAADLLALPRAWEPRAYLVLLRPEDVPEVRGPRWVLGGGGIEYLLPQGYPASAVVLFPLLVREDRP